MRKAVGSASVACRDLGKGSKKRRLTKVFAASGSRAIMLILDVQRGEGLFGHPVGVLRYTRDTPPEQRVVLKMAVSPKSKEWAVSHPEAEMRFNYTQYEVGVYTAVRRYILDLQASRSFPYTFMSNRSQELCSYADVASMITPRKNLKKFRQEVYSTLNEYAYDGKKIKGRTVEGVKVRSPEGKERRVKASSRGMDTMIDQTKFSYIAMEYIPSSVYGDNVRVRNMGDVYRQFRAGPEFLSRDELLQMVCLIVHGIRQLAALRINQNDLHADNVLVTHSLRYFSREKVSESRMFLVATPQGVYAFDTELQPLLYDFDLATAADMPNSQLNNVESSLTSGHCAEFHPNRDLFKWLGESVRVLLGVADTKKELRNTRETARALVERAPGRLQDMANTLLECFVPPHNQARVWDLLMVSIKNDNSGFWMDPVGTGVKTDKPSLLCEPDVLDLLHSPAEAFANLAAQFKLKARSQLTRYTQQFARLPPAERDLHQRWNVYYDLELSDPGTRKSVYDQLFGALA